MNDFAGADHNHNEDELERVPEFMRAAGYLDRRQQEILEYEQKIISLQRGIRDVTIDIARLLVATPSAGNQAILERSFSELNGLAIAVAQSAAALPSGEGGGSRGADVDVTGIRAAIESHESSSGASASKNLDDRTRKIAATAKELPSLDTPPAAGADQDKPTTPGTATLGDTKPASDTPASNLDRISKLASSESRTSDDQAASASSDLPPLPNKRGPRSHVAALKLDHAEAVPKSDAPDREVTARGLDPTAQAASGPAKAEPTIVAAVRKPPSPDGM
jgi:hypothetical protein